MPNGYGYGPGMGYGRGYGYGRGFGWWGGGRGFGFRGASPPWPYVGLGRGGLPRCGYFLSGAAGAPTAWPYQQPPYAAGPGFTAGQASYPYYPETWPAPGATPFAPEMTREQEIDFLKGQAEMIKQQLEQIEARMRDLEAGT